MSDSPDPDRPLRIYLQDHLAGAAAGIALVQRLGANNAGSALGRLAEALEQEITSDRARLEAIMDRLGVAPSRSKALIGKLAVAAGQLKSNGRIVGYSPSSRVVEVEGLAAGIIAKRSLWQALRTATEHRAELDADELDELIGRATDQYERVMAQHRAAAAAAFARPSAAPPTGA